ncbi:antitoxin Xre-like helix-turn-helix domain-containing protein [Amaricoccus sp.]|uniref:antitoxin Xre-like helix-turn-helix domain-containing protein n=1 Tax=Amaricoccus sp. TaxID=1872485 RepID=UPI001B4C8DD2|nr:antitoxin Xre-like helix-turn-helix domain-containing protein [Amaricoccus sp.]MBP6999927.1 DUF2384 domain-containing protein [Amaricoccus sp.]
MKVAAAVAHPEAPPAFRIATRADLARLSGPGLRAFRAIAEEWGLPEKARIALLGLPARSTYHQWLGKAERREPLTLPLDTLTRISGILGVHDALATLFRDRGEAQAWLAGPHRGAIFAGASPLRFAIDGGLDGILTVRRHLDAWRAGALAADAPAADIPPVREEDIVLS